MPELTRTLQPAQPMNPDGTPVDPDWEPEWQITLTRAEDKRSVSMEVHDGKRHLSVDLDAPWAEAFAGEIGSLVKTLEA